MYKVRLSKLTKYQRVQFAIFCAEQVLPVFQKGNPNVPTPLEAIDAAKAWLENPCEDTANAANSASYSIFTIYDNDTVSDAADAAAYAANTAYLSQMVPDTHIPLDGVVATRDIAIDAGADAVVMETYLKELEACTKND